MESAQLSLDGLQVLYCEAGFSGRFDVSPDDADELVYDRPQVWVVVARPDLVQFRDNRTGDLTKKCRLKYDAVKLTKGEVAESILIATELEHLIPEVSIPRVINSRVVEPTQSTVLLEAVGV